MKAGESRSMDRSLPCRAFIALFFACVVAVAAAALWCCQAAAGETAEPVGITLPKAVEAALQHNPAVRAAGGRATAAAEAVRQAESAGGLQVKLDSRYTHLSEVPSMSTIPERPPIKLGEPDAWLADVTAQIILFSGGKIVSQVRQAEGAAKAEEISGVRVRQAVAAGAEQAFWLLAAAQRGREAAQKTLDAAQDHLRSATARFEAKVAAKFDVIRAEVQVAEARQELIRAEMGIETALALFLKALGLERGEYRAVEPQEPPAPRKPLEELLDLARQSRPELAAAGWQVKAAEAGIAAARAEHWPQVGLAADYQYVDPESLSFYNRWAVNVVLSLPLLDWGRVRGKVGQAEAVRDQAVASLEALRLAVASEVRQAYARVVSADAQVVVARKRIEQGEELLRLAGIRYQGGVGTATEIADAQASLTSARQGLTRALAEQGIAGAELRLAVGDYPVGSTTVQEDSR